MFDISSVKMSKICSGEVPMWYFTSQNRNWEIWKNSRRVRICTVCNLQKFEPEEHCLIRCELYPDIRQSLFCASFLINPDFNICNDIDKLCFILSNEKMIFKTAKVCHDSFTTQSAIIYHSWQLYMLRIWHLIMFTVQVIFIPYDT